MPDAAADKQVPTVPTVPSVVKALKRAAVAGGVLTLGVGLAVLAGWTFDVAALRQLHPSLPAMKANAAVACALAGAALMVRAGSAMRARLAGGLSAGVSLIGALTLFEAIPGVDLGIDELLFADETDLLMPGRMSPATALDFVLIGLALGFIDKRVRAAHYPAEWLALLAGFLATVALLGNLYGVQALVEVGDYEEMALHPAITLAVCCGAILCARPTRGMMLVVSSAGPGGASARRFLPAALIVPAVVGSILEAGERAGWFGVEHETALFAASSILTFSVLSWWTASALLKIDVARRGAEDAVRASEEDLATTLDSIGDGVIATDVAGTVTRMNPVAESLTGWPLEEARGRHLDEVLHIVDEDTREPIESPVARVLRAPGAVPESRSTLIARGGDVRPIVDRGAPIRGDGPLRGVVLVLHDMTAERAAEQALRLSQARFARLAESGIVGIVVADAAGKLIEVNEAFARIVGEPRASLLASGRSWDDLVAPSSVAAAEAARALVAAHGFAEPSEQELLRPDGSRAPVLVGSAALGAETIAFVADQRERRERERAERALRTTEAQLRESQKMDAIGRLAGGIAHDFNNLLTVILSYGQLLLRGLEHDPAQADDVGQIVYAAERAADLTRRLLAFSRRQVLQPVVVDLGDVVARMSTMLRRVIGEDIELAIAAAPRLDPVWVDPGQIEQILLNLVVNARDALPRGGRISVETANVELADAEAAARLGAAPGAYVALVVRDNGVGMDAETRSHIFEPFFTTKAAGAGTGLGLATVFGIVQQSGGVIRVESEPEEGAAFEILLPRYTVKAAESARARGVAGAPARGTETVLLVEDDDQVRRLASSVLRGHGYQVLEAADAAQALLRSERHDGPIHLLLTDVVMPKSSGRQLAERLVIERPEIRVLFMSGHTDDAVLRHGVEASALAFIGKPLTPDRLLAKVREVLDGLRGE